MSLPDRPTEIVEWAEDPTALVSDPENERARGFPFQYIPPVNQINWLQRAVGRWIDYLRRSAGGGFSSLPDLIDGLEVGESAPLVLDALRPTQTAFIARSSEILAIATDGKYVYFADTLVSGNIRLWAYDLSAGALTGPALYAFTDAGVDLTRPVKIVTNGTYTVLTFSYSADRARAVVLKDLAVIDVDNGPVFASDAAVDGLVIAGDRYALTWTGVGGVNTTEIREFGGASIDTLFQSDTIIQATNGDVFIASVGAGTIEARSNTGDLIWTDTFGATGSVPSVAMTDRQIYFVGGDDDLRVIAAGQSSGAGSQILLPSLDVGDIKIDARREIIYQPAGVDVLLGFSAISPNTAYAYMEIAEDLDSIAGFASDGAHVYIAGAVSGGDFGIWQIAKGSAPAIYRRLDPDDNDSWPRTLAAPI